MNIQAKAGKKILTGKHDTYRLNLLQRDDESPVLVLVRVDVFDGTEICEDIAELDMSAIYEQVFRIVEGV